jgi:hypothetical protein
MGFGTGPNGSLSVGQAAAAAISGALFGTLNAAASFLGVNLNLGSIPSSRDLSVAMGRLQNMAAIRTVNLSGGDDPDVATVDINDTPDAGLVAGLTGGLGGPGAPGLTAGVTAAGGLGPNAGVPGGQADVGQSGNQGGDTVDA